MAMNIEGYGALAPASVRQRQQTDARQDRWMSELEHAMLQSAKKPVSPAAKHQQPAAPPPAPLPESPLDGAGPDAALAAAAVTASAPLAPAAVAPPGSEPAAAAVSSQPGAGAAAPVQAATEAPAEMAGAAGRPSLSAASAPVPAAAPLPALATTASSAPRLTPGAASAVAPALLAASPVLAGSAPQGADSLDNNVKVSPVPANAGWLPGGAGAPAAPEPAWAGGDHAAVADLPTAPTFSDDDQQYAARLLHVYRDADGVQAWVRDASLGQQQAQQLVRAMVSELGSAGAPLTALTVNGRRQMLPAARASQERTDADADETGAAAPVARLTPYLNGAL